jgi:acyl carrier protein
MEEKLIKVKTIIADQLDINQNDILLESSLIDDLEADSLDIVELIMTFEDEFNLKIENDDLESIKTVADIVKLCNK